MKTDAKTNCACVETRAGRRFLREIRQTWDSPEPWQATALGGLSDPDLACLRAMASENHEDTKTVESDVMAVIRHHAEGGLVLWP